MRILAHAAALPPIARVLLHHLDLKLRITEALPWSAPVLGRGSLGVDGVFLLSGFAPWLGYAARPPPGWRGIGAFLLRRVARIRPLHLAARFALAPLVGLPRPARLAACRPAGAALDPALCCPAAAAAAGVALSTTSASKPWRSGWASSPARRAPGWKARPWQQSTTDSDGAWGVGGRAGGHAGPPARCRVSR